MMKNPSLNELIEHIRKLAPYASVDEDLEGQLVVYTNLCMPAPRRGVSLDNEPMRTFDPDGVQSDPA
jgi:hypothetical protein